MNNFTVYSRSFLCRAEYSSRRRDRSARRRRRVVTQQLSSLNGKIESSGGSARCNRLRFNFQSRVFLSEKFSISMARRFLKELPTNTPRSRQRERFPESGGSQNNVEKKIAHQLAFREHVERCALKTAAPRRRGPPGKNCQGFCNVNSGLSDSSTSL